MSFRRDKLTAGVETFDWLEMLEMEGEKYFLDDLRFLEGRSTKEHEKLIRDWVDEKTLWFQRLPQMIKLIEKADDFPQKINDLIQALKNVDEELRQNIKNANIIIIELIGDKEGTLGQILIDAVRGLEKERGLVYREIKTLSSELNNYLRQASLERLLQKEKVTDEIHKEDR